MVNVFTLVFDDAFNMEIDTLSFNLNGPSDELTLCIEYIDIETVAGRGKSTYHTKRPKRYLTSRCYGDTNLLLLFYRGITYGFADNGD